MHVGEKGGEIVIVRGRTSSGAMPSVHITWEPQQKHGCEGHEEGIRGSWPRRWGREQASAPRVRGASTWHRLSYMRGRVTSDDVQGTASSPSHLAVSRRQRISQIPLLRDRLVNTDFRKNRADYLCGTQRREGFCASALVGGRIARSRVRKKVKPVRATRSVRARGAGNPAVHT